MKRTPLFDEHVRLGGKMVEFAGWEMPVYYVGINEEHRAVRGIRRKEARDEEEGEEMLSDEVTVEAIDEALAEEEGLRLSQEVVIEIERLMLASSAASASLRDADVEQVEVVQMDDDESIEDEEIDEDGELLATAITRLSGTDDPVGLSHIVGGVVQLPNVQRQELLEAPDALTRLRLLDQHLQREQLLLSEGVRPWSADPRALRSRRN